MYTLGTTKPMRPASRRETAAAIPEGPYETPGGRDDRPASRPEINHLIDFIEHLQDEAERLLGLSGGQREMRIIAHLVRNHRAGRLVTMSSLAAASGLSYGTALRTIEGMFADGLIVKRERTATGRSHSLHPSPALLMRWNSFAYRADQLVRAAAQLDPASPGWAQPRYRTPAGTVLPAPPVLETKLPLSRGLRVLVHADPTFMAMHSLKRQFEMILGVGIESRALSIDRLRAEIIENSRLAVSRYDIVACHLPWFGEMASQKRLLPLSGLLAETGMDTDDIYPDALASARYRGEPFGIPIMTTAEMLVYRLDLLQEAAVAPPRTTAAVIEAARRLDRRWPGVSGIAWNGGRGTPVGHTFIMLMSAFGQPVVNLRATRDGFDPEFAEGEELRPMFLSQEARATAEYLRELMPYSPPNILEMTWYDRATAYARGHAAMCYSHTLLAPLFELDKASPAYRRSGYLPHPVGMHGRPIVPMGGYALAIPANIAPERIPAVWLALRSLTSASVAKLYLMHGSLASPRFSVTRDPEVQALSPIVAAVEDMVAQGHLRMWPRPPVPGIAEIIAIAGEEIHDLLSGRKTIREALTVAQNRADGVMRRLGFY
jgi:multiple sugar transport system substrate-binding protein